MTSELKESHASPAGYAVGYTVEEVTSLRTGFEMIDAGRLVRSRPLHRPERQLPLSDDEREEIGVPPEPSDALRVMNRQIFGVDQ